MSNNSQPPSTNKPNPETLAPVYVWPRWWRDRAPWTLFLSRSSEAFKIGEPTTRGVPACFGFCRGRLQATAASDQHRNMTELGTEGCSNQHMLQKLSKKPPPPSSFSSCSTRRTSMLQLQTKAKGWRCFDACCAMSGHHLAELSMRVHAAVIKHGLEPGL